MKKLNRITFTGIDEYTKKEDLVELSKKYPLIEFGFLTSSNWENNGNKYPNPKIIQEELLQVIV